MDKATVIASALRKIGERRYEEDSAPEAAVNLLYPQAVRLCAGRYKWSFATVCRRHLECAEEVKVVRDMFKPSGHKRGDRRHRHEEDRKKNVQGEFERPVDCMRVQRVEDEAGEEVAEWWLGYDVVRQKQMIYAPGYADIYVTYGADLVEWAAGLPDENPLFCEGVICRLGSMLAQALGLDPNMAAALEARSEEYLLEAIVQDKRQYRSNDQGTLKGILRRNVLRGAGRNATLYNLYYR